MADFKKNKRRYQVKYQSLVNSIDKWDLESTSNEMDELWEMIKEKDAPVIKKILTEFTTICLAYYECIKCERRWEVKKIFCSKILSKHLLSVKDFNSHIKKAIICPKCNFKLPGAFLFPTSPAYIRILMISLGHLVNYRLEESIIFACSTLESFLFGILSHKLKELKTDQKLVDYLLGDARPLLSTYSSLLEKFELINKKRIDSLREIYDMRNGIIHKGETIDDVRNVEQGFIKLAKLIREFSYLHPKLYGKYNFWLGKT